MIEREEIHAAMITRAEIRRAIVSLIVSPRLSPRLDENYKVLQI